MIRLDVSCPDECDGRTWTKFVSYYEGKLLRALEYESQEFGSSYKTVDLDFNPLSQNVIVSRIEGNQLADGIFEQVRLAELWKLYGGVFRLQSSAPPLTEHLPPPSILIEDGGSWLVSEPVAEEIPETQPQEIPLPEISVQEPPSVETLDSKEVLSASERQNVKELSPESVSDDQPEIKQESPAEDKEDPQENSRISKPVNSPQVE